jgi:hypothetical protein
MMVDYDYDDGDKCGISGGMIDKGNRSSVKIPVLIPLCLPQIPHDLTRYQTQTTAVASLRLTV